MYGAGLRFIVGNCEIGTLSMHFLSEYFSIQGCDQIYYNELPIRLKSCYAA